MRMQSKRHSAVEAVSNVVVGYLVALGSQLAIFPFFNIHVAFNDNLLIGLWFSIISIIRSYCLRRVFNRVT